MNRDTLEAIPLAVAGAIGGVYKYGVKEWLHENASLVGWATIGAFALAWDLKAPETLTHGAHEQVHAHPIITRTAIGLVALHLATPKYSPVDLVWDFVK